MTVTFALFAENLASCVYCSR